MAGVPLWVVFSIFTSIFNIAGSTYTISSENRLTTESTTTKDTYWFSDEELASGKAKYDYTVIPKKGGQVICDQLNDSVSNCDILVRVNDNWRHISTKVGRLLWHLTSVEGRVLKVLGHLQEVRGTLHTRPERSAGAGAEAGADHGCEAAHNATRAISEELDTVKNRQVFAGLIATLQLVLFIVYLGVKIVFYTIDKCKKHHEKLAEEELELIETRLQEQRSKRRAAASRTKSIIPQE